MKIWLARDDDYLIPTDDDGLRVVRRLELGECVWVDIIRPRSARWLRLYFGLCKEIGQNQEPTVDEHVIDAKVRVLAGHYDIMGHLEIDGQKIEIRTPKSIAFKNLTHDQWVQLWPSLELAMRENYGIGPQLTPL